MAAAVVVGHRPRVALRRVQVFQEQEFHSTVTETFGAGGLDQRPVEPFDVSEEQARVTAPVRLELVEQIFDMLRRHTYRYGPVVGTGFGDRLHSFDRRGAQDHVLGLELKELDVIGASVRDDRAVHEPILGSEESPQRPVEVGSIDAPTAPAPLSQHPGVVVPDRFVAADVEIEPAAGCESREQGSFAPLTWISARPQVREAADHRPPEEQELVEARSPTDLPQGPDEWRRMEPAACRSRPARRRVRGDLVNAHGDREPTVPRTMIYVERVQARTRIRRDVLASR